MHQLQQDTLQKSFEFGIGDYIYFDITSVLHRLRNKSNRSRTYNTVFEFLCHAIKLALRSRWFHDSHNPDVARWKNNAAFHDLNDIYSVVDAWNARCSVDF